MFICLTFLCFTSIVLIVICIFTMCTRLFTVCSHVRISAYFSNKLLQNVHILIDFTASVYIIVYLSMALRSGQLYISISQTINGFPLLEASCICRLSGPGWQEQLITRVSADIISEVFYNSLQGTLFMLLCKIFTCISEGIFWQKCMVTFKAVIPQNGFSANIGVHVLESSTHFPLHTQWTLQCRVTAVSSRPLV